MKRGAASLIAWVAALVLAGCATPSTVSLPDNDEIAARQITLSDISQLPPPVTRVMSGDSLRIVRDSQSPAERDEATVFFVRSDGSFSYPHIGIVQAAGRTLEEIGEAVSRKLEPIYRYPRVTVNIASAPGNRVFVGGAVRNPSAFELTAAVSIEQAIIGAGGVLPTADSQHVALLRMDANGLYNVYFADFSKLLQPSAEKKAVVLQRGDIVFVPKSSIGNAIEVSDLYFNQLLPFSKGVGVGFNYDLNRSGDTTVNYRSY